MSVAVLQTPVAPFHMTTAHSPSTPTSSWLPPHKAAEHANSVASAHVNIWSMIQSQNPAGSPPAAAPYIHPLVRQSKARMNQKSLEMCTESLGSETGSSKLDELDCFSTSLAYPGENRACQKEESSLDHHCSISRRSPPRSFPPPLPSISRHDGSSIHMRPHRQDGRLVVEAIPIPSQNYLHARRHNGRLLLSLVNTSIRQSDITDTISTETLPSQQSSVEHKEKVKESEHMNSEDKPGEGIDNVTNDEETEDEEEEDEEEEVEVVDRGTMVEVKVSTQPQQQNGATKVLRSSIVINKFVGGAPLGNENRWAEPQRRTATTRTTAAAAAVAASSVNATMDVVGHCLPPTDSKLLFTSKGRNREEMLLRMRCCSELRRPLFFWEPCCIATS